MYCLQVSHVFNLLFEFYQVPEVVGQVGHGLVTTRVRIGLRHGCVVPFLTGHLTGLTANAGRDVNEMSLQTPGVSLIPRVG